MLFGRFGLVAYRKRTDVRELSSLLKEFIDLRLVLGSERKIVHPPQTVPDQSKSCSLWETHIALVVEKPQPYIDAEEIRRN
jgi:hypothetical protein